MAQQTNTLTRFESVSHTKTTLVGTSISIPITDGRMNLGTWQGVAKSISTHHEIVDSACSFIKEST